MDNNFMLFLDAATVSASMASRRGFLDIPTADENDTLYKRSDTDIKWREHFEVKDTKIAPKADDPKVAVITVQYRVTDEAYPKNAKRVFTKNYYINTEAMRDANHPEYKKTMMNIGKLNSMIRACGVELEKDDNGRVGYHTYFNDEKPLVGKRFWGVVRAYSYKNRNDEIVDDQDIDNFIPEDK
jgi:hypothetical protein